MMMDDALSKLVTQLRKATDEQVEEALEELERRRAAGEKLDLVDVLLGRGVLEEATALRLRKHAAREMGPRIPGYLIVEPLGGGGMGRVYAAKQVQLDRLVALKVLAPELMRDKEAQARFLREAKAAGRLDHANIVKAYDVSIGDPDNDVPPYIAMEFVRGETLHSLLLRKKRLSERLTLKIASAMAAALDHAHRQDLVHRDVKPDNIMLTSKGEVKLCDLGLAKRIGQDQTLTHSGMTHGTPHFMSPEQAQGRRDLDIRSDLYSLGCTMFRTVVGKAPYVADTALELLMAHVEKAIPSAKALRPDLSIDFDRIVRRLMAKVPEERYQYPVHLQTDVELVLAGESPRLDWGVPYRRASDTATRGSAAAASAAANQAGPGKLTQEESLVVNPPSSSVEPLDFLEESETGDSAVARTGLDVEELFEEVGIERDGASKPTTKKKKKKKKRAATANDSTQRKGKRGTRKGSGNKRRKSRKQTPATRIEWFARRVVTLATSLREWLRAHYWSVTYVSAFVIVAALGFGLSTLLIDSEPGVEENGERNQRVGPRENGATDEAEQWQSEAEQRRAKLDEAQQAEQQQYEATQQQHEDAAEHLRELLFD